MWEDQTDTKMCYKATLMNGFGGVINKQIRGMKKNPEIDSHTYGS